MFDMESRHWWFRGTRRIILGLVRRHLPEAPSGRPLRLLDVGCGTGISLELMQRELGVEGYGLDAEPTALQLSRERGLDRLTVGTMERVPYGDGTFDVVTALDVVEHIEDDVAALREAGRVLRPGGRIVITVPAYPWLWSEHDRALHHQRRYTRAVLEERIAAAGLRPLHVTGFNTTLLPPIAAWRVARRLLVGAPKDGPAHSDVSLPPAPVNRLLYGLLAGEERWLRRRRLPLGVSIGAVAVHAEEKS